MLFLQYFMINLVLTKSSGPKRHAVLLTVPIFAGFCVHHTDLEDLKSPVHALFTIFYDKFSFNQVFGSKTPCSFAYRADLCRFLCASHRSWWEGSVAIAAFPPPPATPTPRSNFCLNRPSLTAVGRFTHRFVGNSAHRP